MRSMKDIATGTFPGEDKPMKWFKCSKCGYATHTGNQCPNCGQKNNPEIK